MNKFGTGAIQRLVNNVLSGGQLAAGAPLSGNITSTVGQGQRARMPPKKERDEALTEFVSAIWDPPTVISVRPN